MNEDIYRRSINTTGYGTKPRDAEEGVAGYTAPTWDDLHPYSRDGSDLIIVDEGTLVDDIEQYLRFLENKDVAELSLADIDTELIEDAARIEAELKARLDAMSEEDTLFAHAIQDWTLEELRKHEAERGYAHEQGSDESYLETVEVLETLLDQLVAEDEDARLIALTDVWREETLAELRTAKLQSYYELVA